jgi:hypothetical protein
MCKKCYNYEVENCFHVMFNCTRYSKIRLANMNNYIIPDCPKQYLEFFYEMSNLFIYFKNCWIQQV